MSRPRVLLVDDDEDVRHMTRVSLGFEGFDVTEAEDGTEGLAAARSDRPDAMILDVMMPGMDGLAVLRELREDPGLADLPVLILTAKAGSAAEQEGWDAGATAYLTKPFTGTALAGTLRRLLDGDGGDTRGTALARLDLAQRMTAAADTLSPGTQR
ncbi:MAG TPA: response regulator [Mycobacteriales bacterium]|nr:response regulator [Mycobacteriales bacterium]